MALLHLLLPPTLTWLPPLRPAVLRPPWFKNRAKTGAIILGSSVQVTLAREPCDPKEDLAAARKRLARSAVEHPLSKANTRHETRVEHYR